MSIEPHWHWTFTAYNGPEVTLPTQQFTWGVEISITGNYDEESARAIAASVIRRDHYELRRVYECTTCGYQESTAHSIAKLAKDAQ